MSSSPNPEMDVFVPFNPEPFRESGFESPSGGGVPAFQVADALWATLTTDPLLKVELDRLVEERIGSEIRARVAAGEKELREKITLEAREAGLLEAKAQAAASADALRTELDAICRQVLDASKSRTERHETVWIQALSLLLKRFLVPNDAQVVERIQRWLRESLEDVAKGAAVDVFLSPEQYQRLSAGLGKSGPHWKWHSDPSLNEGEIRCETDQGGVVFSPGEQWERLDRIVRETLGEGVREA
jgi:flagellar biosynthesis/type III secretory pathway protein FliH